MTMTVTTADLVTALVAMREAALGTSLLAGGWSEEGDNPAPIWPYAELEVEPSSWDEFQFLVTERVYTDTPAQGRTIADQIINALNLRAYDGTGVDIRAHLLSGGPTRRRTYERSVFELTWIVTAIWP